MNRCSVISLLVKELQLIAVCIMVGWLENQAEGQRELVHLGKRLRLCASFITWNLRIVSYSWDCPSPALRNGMHGSGCAPPCVIGVMNTIACGCLCIPF
jgi:hypothetical protein